MSNVISLRTPEERVKAILALVKPAPQVEIRTLHDALKWGDSWREAYRQLYRQAVQEADALRAQLLWMRVDLTIERGERLFERLALEDEIKRLRGLL